jgi:hypothetical protein
MKAPSVREGSKENGTAAKIPPVSIMLRRRDRPSTISPNKYKVLPSHNSSKPRLRIRIYPYVGAILANSRLEN